MGAREWGRTVGVGITMMLQDVGFKVLVPNYFKCTEHSQSRATRVFLGSPEVRPQEKLMWGKQFTTLLRAWFLMGW